MMFSDIPTDRYGRISAVEQRWLENLKKAFFHSDEAMLRGEPQDCCLEEVFKAIDTAKTLRRSLRGEDTSTKHNIDRFIEFIALEMPAARTDGSTFPLRHSRSGREIEMNLGEIIYDIRCMVHENENLNAAENIDYHISLDWSVRNPQVVATVCDGRITVNGYCLWGRLREILSKFITSLDSSIGMANGATSFSITIKPPLGSIRAR